MAEANTASGPSRQGFYKVTIHANRRKGMSEEDFHKHWTTSHAPKISQFLRKYGVVGYTQYHTPSWVRAEAAEKLKSLGDFAIENLAGYDGYVELRMPDLQCYEDARNDPHYAKVVQPDEEEFFDMASSKLTIGWEETYIDATLGGRVAESVRGGGEASE